MPLSSLRRAVDHNTKLIHELQEAFAEQNQESIRTLLIKLEDSNCDLYVVLEEATDTYPPLQRDVDAGE